MESGFYWIYTLDDQGNPLEIVGKPTICYYAKENNTVTFLGYDCSLHYSPEDYRLLRKVEYTE